MADSIRKRVARLVAGGVHSLLGTVENRAPELVMEGALREIDETLDEVRVELGKVLAGKHLANKRLMEENRKHEELRESLEIALKQGREDLAEVAASRQIDIEIQVPILEQDIAECRSRETELETFINALGAKRREMQEELRLYRASLIDSALTNEKKLDGSSPHSFASKAERAQAAFDQTLERATGLHSSKQGLRLDSASQLAELEALARKEKIKQRIQEIKNSQTE